MAEEHDTVPVQDFNLSEDEELRLEVHSGGSVLLELISGTAEIFGTELLTRKRYHFESGKRVAVFTWQGCHVKITGEADSPYVAKKTPMVIYLNTHAALEQLRQSSESQAVSNPETRGPRLMIVGPTDVGKSTYCRVLLNYAVRQGRTPIYVDLDVGQNGISIPGTISATYVERTADPAEGFERKQPIVYNFGHLSPGGNIAHYELLMKDLAETVNLKCKAVKDANFGGLIINTCGWVRGAGYSCIVSAAEAFEVDVVVVLDHERLYNDLQRDLPNFVRICHQPKSGGVESRSQAVRINSRKNKIRHYFYGGNKVNLFPYSFQLDFGDIEIWKVGAAALPESCLPIGVEQEDPKTKVVQVTISQDINQHILALTQVPDSSKPQQLARAPVMGFICVTEVDMEHCTITVLSPQPHPLPNKILLYSQVTYVDDK